MPHQTYQDCINACNACLTACLHCAASCLKEPNPAELADCIRLDLDCADLCETAVRHMARGSTNARAVCALCADICQQCGAECAKHKQEHCQTCARACEKCAQTCRSMQ